MKCCMRVLALLAVLSSAGAPIDDLRAQDISKHSACQQRSSASQPRRAAELPGQFSWGLFVRDFHIALCRGSFSLGSWSWPAQRVNMRGMLLHEFPACMRMQIYGL